MLHGRYMDVTWMFSWFWFAELTTVGEFKREYAALVQVKLVFIRFGVVKNLHVATLHADSQPLAGRTVTQRKDLTQEDR